MEIHTGTLNLPTGDAVSIRPIRPEDESKMVEFHRTLSESSVYSRYPGFMKLDTRVEHERLARICHLDSGRQMALVAERTPPGGSSPEILPDNAHMRKVCARLGFTFHGTMEATKDLC